LPHAPACAAAIKSAVAAINDNFLGVITILPTASEG
jgi:hypothetical protein